MEDDDAIEIAVRLLCGQEDGIDQLLQKYGRRVAGVLKFKFPDVPEDDRTAVMYIAARRAVRAIGTFDEKKGTLAAWFTRIAINCLIDMLEAGRTDFRKDIGGKIEALEDTKAPDPFPEQKEPSTDPDLLVALEQAIDELPDQLRRVVRADLAADSCQANTADLADDLGVGVASIRQYRKRYKEKLAEIMRQKGHTTARRRVTR